MVFKELQEHRYLENRLVYKDLEDLQDRKVELELLVVPSQHP